MRDQTYSRGHIVSYKQTDDGPKLPPIVFGGGNDAVLVRLVIRGESAKAIRVQLADSQCTKTAWLPKSKVSYQHLGEYVELQREQGGNQTRFQISQCEMPCWLYDKLVEQL
jgi:hypothetical protein